MSIRNRHCKPPKFAEFLLRRILPDGSWDTPIGDFEEFYNSLARERGILKANLWYWTQVCKLIPTKVLNSFYWSVQMFKNYMKVAFRNITRHKGFSLINITGLAVGMACCILIFLWVADERSYDQFHENGENLYIVATHIKYGSRTATSSGTPSALGPALKNEYPEVINSVRFCNGPHALYFAYEDKKFREEAEAVDPSFLQMFSFPMVSGEPESALKDPHSLVMSEEMAAKYFGKKNPIGEIIRVNNTYDFTVMGVFKDLPHNSILQFDYLVNIAFLKELWNSPQLLTRWYDLSFTTFVQLQDNVSAEVFSSKITDRINEEFPKDDVKPFLWSFTKIYLHGLGTGGGRILRVRMLSMVALFVLIIACINFMNLTTAKSGKRAKEIGMRKVSGAYKIDIIKQFFGESVLLALLSLALGVVLVLLLLPVFSGLTGKTLSLNISENPSLVFGLLGIALITGLLAGSYPALLMSSFQPVKIMRGSTGAGSKKSSLRKILVVFQFVVTITLIIWTVVVYEQLDYMRNKDLGFNKDHLVYVPVSGALREHYDAAKQEMLKVPGVSGVSMTSRTPLLFGSSGSNWQWEGKSEDTNPSIRYFCCDYDFAKTFEVEMDHGQFFSEEITKGGSVQSGQVVINEQLAEIIGKEDPVGMRLSHGSWQAMIIGVVKDFNYWPLYRRSGPLIIFHKSYNDEPNRYRFMFARVRSENIQHTIAGIKDVYETFNPEFPFIYRFLEDDYVGLYVSEERTGSVVKYFSLLAILVSCLGLFGLAAFMAEQRTKEIGIRKVLGSSVQGIILLLSKEFVKWVVLANIIAWPIAWLMSRAWLQNFAYRTAVEAWMFLFAGVLALGIAVLTVSYQSIKAATANPVDSLRYE
ncbi:MAG: ABC transporter permease [Candidatus Aminicenantes bacterium]|jgi:ABC-type antimicrobial peptide transport system permease subunit